MQISGAKKTSGRKVLKVARPAGVEPAAFGVGGQHSIQLSYGREAVSVNQSLADVKVKQAERLNRLDVKFQPALRWRGFLGGFYVGCNHLERAFQFYAGRGRG